MKCPVFSPCEFSGKLAACVNISPGVSSVYEWEGKINTDSEAGFADPI